MAARLVFHLNLNNYSRKMKIAAVTAAAIQTQSFARLAVSRSNRGGINPSNPGEPPRADTGTGRAAIAVEVKKWAFSPYSKVGLLPHARYMAWLEFGTRAKGVVRKKGGGYFIIPWRPKGDARRAANPTPWDIAHFGLKKIWVVQGQRRRRMWVMFRKQFHHTGIKPRPWLFPTVQRRSRAIALAAGSAAAAAARTAR